MVLGVDWGWARLIYAMISPPHLRFGQVRAALPKSMYVSGPTRGRSRVHDFGHSAEASHRSCFTTSALASIQRVRVFVNIHQRSLVLSKKGDKHLEAPSSQPEGSYEAVFGELKKFRAGAAQNVTHRAPMVSANGSSYSNSRLDSLSERGR